MDLLKKNPTFRGIEKDLENDYERTDCSTVHGVFGKTFILVGIAILGAVLAIAFLYNLTEDNIGTFIGLLAASLILSLVAGLIANFSIRLCPVFSVAYCASMGFMLGVISLIVELYYPGVAISALIATFGVTIVMGILYFTGVIKVNHKFKAFIIASLIGILVTGLISFALAMAGFGQMDELLHGDGVIGWLVSIFVVIIAALSLCIDFDYAANIADMEAPKKYEWRAAFGLTVGIIYLYIRLLDLFLRIAAASKK